MCYLMDRYILLTIFNKVSNASLRKSIRDSLIIFIRELRIVITKKNVCFSEKE